MTVLTQTSECNLSDTVGRKPIQMLLSPLFALTSTLDTATNILAILTYPVILDGLLLIYLKPLAIGFNVVIIALCYVQAVPWLFVLHLFHIIT